MYLCIVQHPICVFAWLHFSKIIEGSPVYDGGMDDGSPSA